MAGLVAVVAHERGAEVPAEEVAALVRAYEHVRGPASSRHQASAGEWAHVVHLGDPAGNPLQPDGPDWALAVGALHADAPPAAAALAELDGTFALARHHAAREEVEILNDRLGMQHLYLAERAGRSYLSTSATTLARHLALPPDPLGARLFVRSGGQFGPVTHFQGLERLDPATLLTFAPGRRTRETWWRPEVDERVRAMNLRQLTDHFAQVALATIDRRLSGRPCLWADLTGGYDSRLIAVLLDKVGIPFQGNTSGEVETADVRLAREVAKAGGWPWRQELLPGDWRLEPNFVEEATGWGEGTLEVLLLGEVLWRQEERARTCPVVVNGAGGGHLNPFPWLQEFARAGRSREVNYDNLMRMRMLPPTGGPEILRAQPHDEVDRYAREVLSKRTEGYADELNTTKLDLIHGYKSVGHFGAFRSAFEARVRTETPLYYHDIFTTAFSTHHRWRNGHRLHRAVTERLNRRVAAVPTERGGPAQLARLGNLHRFLPYYAGLGQTAVRKLRGRPAPSSPLPEVVARGYGHAVRSLRTLGVLDPGQMRSAALYDSRALKDLVAASDSPTFSQWPLLGRVATLELVLRKVPGATL